MFSAFKRLLLIFVLVGAAAHLVVACAGRRTRGQAMVKDYEGRESASAGEEFIATIQNIEKTVTRAALSSGMKLALLPKKSSGGAVEGVLVLHTGSEKDVKGKVTAAEMLPGMLMRGTRQHSHQQLRDEFDRLKAEVHFGSDELGSVNVRITTVGETLPEVLTLIAEILKQPAFPEDQFEIVRKNLLAALEGQLQIPAAQAFTTLFRNVNPWPKHDVRYQPTTKERIERASAVELTDLVQLYRDTYGSSSAELALVGDFDPGAITNHLERLLGDWRSPRPYKRIEIPYRGNVPGSEIVIQMPDKEITIVIVAHGLAASNDDRDYPALEMINHVLGSSVKSRLTERLSQKDGLSCTAFSSMAVAPFDRMGLFMAGATCTPQNAGESTDYKIMDYVMEELSRFVQDGISQDELEESKKSYKLSYDNGLAEDNYLVNALAECLYLKRTLDYYTERNEKIQQLDTEQIREAITKHIDLDKLVKLKVGDFEEVAVEPAAGGAGQ